MISQAIVFWVVDNFLKQSIQNTKSIYINSNHEGRVKYFHNTDSLKCYSRIERTEDPDCDMLLSADDEGEMRQRPPDPPVRRVRWWTVLFS